MKFFKFLFGKISDILQKYGITEESAEIYDYEKLGWTWDEAEDLRQKVKSDRDLTVEDVKKILANQDKLEIKGYNSRVVARVINSKITGELGNRVYKSILEDLKEENVIPEVREDLVDPNKNYKDFEKVNYERGKYFKSKNYRDIGHIPPPNKEPESLREIITSVLNYLKVLGRGFNFDSEMIYSVEEDYRSFLEAVINLKARELKDYKLNVEYRNGLVSIDFYTNQLSFNEDFEHKSDWIDRESLLPISKALKEECSAKIYFRGGNDGILMILEEKDLDILREKLNNLSGIKPILSD